MASDPRIDRGTRVDRRASLDNLRAAAAPAGLDAGADDLPISIGLNISPELDEAMKSMAVALDGSKSEVFVRALTLMRLAIDAKKAGKRLCIADEDLNVETEIHGFGPLDEAPDAPISHPEG